MKLSEVMKDSKIKIHGSINGHGILLITKAALGVRDGLLVDSLTYFDEDIVFREPTKIIAVNNRDGRSYEYEAQSVGPVETKYGKFHLIRCPDSGTAINRRQAERYDIDRLGIVRINRGGDMRNAIVYDISMKGIAFILDSDAICKVGDHISSSFRYDPNYFHFYACEATVVRVFTIDNQVAIGCRMDSMGADLITLIGNKRREKSGITVDDFLGIKTSPDRKIASGEKIPVNYAPPLHTTEIIDEDLGSPINTQGLTDKDSEGSINPEENYEAHKYITLEEAAKLIPERKSDKKTSPKRADNTGDFEISWSKGNDHSGASKPEAKDQSEGYGASIPKAKNRKEGYGTSIPKAKNQKEGYGTSIPKAKDQASDLRDLFSRQKGNSHSGFAVDERLFAPGQDDNFLTPEQISDIIELERIHKNNF